MKSSIKFKIIVMTVRRKNSKASQKETHKPAVSKSIILSKEPHKILRYGIFREDKETHVHVLVIGAFQCGLAKGAKVVRGGDGSVAGTCWSCACKSLAPGGRLGTEAKRCRFCVAVRNPPIKRGLRQVGQEYVSANPWSSLSTSTLICYQEASGVVIWSY